MAAADGSVQILLVEDNAADVRLTQEVFRDASMVNELHVARDGVEAMDYLHHQDDFADAERPDLVILDLNMPRKDGREVLAEMRADPELRSIPVAILSTSESEDDVTTSYELGANCFLTKPVSLEGFIEVVHAIESFWLAMVRLPGRPTQDVA
jgi:CheY-like chemotaxis protein